MLAARRAVRPGARASASPLVSCGRRYASLVVAGSADSALPKATRQAVSAAGQLSTPVTVLAPEGAAEAASKVAGVDAVVAAPVAAFASPEALADLVVALQRGTAFDHVVGCDSAVCKDCIPRASGILDVQPVANVVAVHDSKTVSRLLYAGNAVARVRSGDRPLMANVRPTAFEAAAASGGAGVVSAAGAAAEEAVAAAASKSTVLGVEGASSSGPQLATASRVVSGGRGLGDAQRFDAVLSPLCAKLGAALGATRAAVDAGFCANELQVGQTGKVVAPDVYVAVGVSGAIQHIAGMKDSKVIVAVNKDADAPIFQVADYGLVGDLFKVVPEMVEKI